VHLAERRGDVPRELVLPQPEVPQLLEAGERVWQRSVQLRVAGTTLDSAHAERCSQFKDDYFTELCSASEVAQLLEAGERVWQRSVQLCVVRISGSVG